LMDGVTQRSLFLLKMVMDLSKNKLASAQRSMQDSEKNGSSNAERKKPVHAGDQTNKFVIEVKKKRERGLSAQKKKEKARKQEKKTSSKVDMASESSLSHGNHDALVMYDDSIERSDDRMKDMINRLATMSGIPQQSSSSELSKMIFNRLSAFEKEFNEATCANILLAKQFVSNNAKATPDVPWQARAEDFYF